MSQLIATLGGFRFFIFPMAISNHTRRIIVANLTRGGLCKQEISERTGVPLHAVRQVADGLWKRNRSYDYAKRASPFGK